MGILWSHHITNFKFWDPNHNSEMTEATLIKFCTHVGHIKLVILV